MYRHVDILNDAGIRARVLHRRRGFRCTWFDNDTAVTSSEETEVGPDDTLVVGELDIDLVVGAARPVRHVVLNQSGHLTWQHRPEVVVSHYAAPRGLLGVVVVSDHSAAYVAHAYPEIPVVRVWNGVDPAVFHLGGGSDRALGYHPRRGAGDADQVLHMLRARGKLGGWEVRRFEGMPQRDFARALRTTRVVLSTTYQEGFGLPIAEAMASGCVVVGYHGFGGQELMDPSFSVPVPTGDVLALATALEDVLEQDRLDPDWCTRRGASAARFIAGEYSLEREAASVVAAYRDLLSRST